LNYPIIKSELLAACYPSNPEMPTPTLAVVIMFTSLAPSPIANVVFLGNLVLTTETISAFYLGEILHASTTLTLSAISKKYSI
jgi:hypothetical protein